MSRPLLAMLAVLGLAIATLAHPSDRASAQAGGVEIVSASSYRNRVGTLRLVGEVVNRSGATVTFVKVIVSYYDAGGALIATDSGYTELDELLPEEMSPFEVLTLDAPTGIAQYETFVEFDRARREPLRGFDVSLGSVRTNSVGSLRITGEVRNNTAVEAEFVRVIAALYDGNGTVIRVDSTYAERDTIPAGGRSPFEVLILDAPDYSSYRLWVDGRLAR
jgi:hypothetical protein